MTEEMKLECIDFSITACEKHATNYEVRKIYIVILSFCFKIVIPYNTRQWLHSGDIRRVLTRTEFIATKYRCNKLPPVLDA